MSRSATPSTMGMLDCALLVRNASLIDPPSPERLSSRFEIDETTRNESGFSDSTYQTIFDRLEREGEDVRTPISCTVQP